MLRFNLETDLWLGEGILRKNGVSCGLGQRLGDAGHQDGNRESAPEAIISEQTLAEPQIRQQIES